MTISEFLKKTIDIFKRGGIDSAVIDAEVILADFLGLERYRLLTHGENVLSAGEVEELERRRARRLGGEPVAYITGRKEFYSLEFFVNSNVLIPRPETELLVDLAVFYAEENSLVLDLGTGSGAIAAALKYNRRDVTVAASDISQGAVNVAADNIRRLLPDCSVYLICGDLFSPFKSNVFDMVITNPPYLDPAESGYLQRELACEPRAALFSADRGRHAVSEIISQSGRALKKNGMLFMEIAPGLKDFVINTGKEHGFTVSVFNDYADLPRVAFFQPV